MNKKIKKILIISLLFIIGFGCVFAMVERAEQMNRSMGYETNYSTNN